MTALKKSCSLIILAFSFVIYTAAPDLIGPFPGGHLKISAYDGVSGRVAFADLKAPLVDADGLCVVVQLSICAGMFDKLGLAAAIWSTGHVLTTSGSLPSPQMVSYWVIFASSFLAL